MAPVTRPVINPVPGARRSFPLFKAGLWRWVILIVAGMYFLLPLYAAIRFAGIKAYGDLIGASGFTSALWLSVRLAIITTLITLALMLPTTVYVHLKLPGLRRLLESLTILPIVIPPVVLATGLLQVAPASLKNTPYILALEYVVLAMPFAYRTIDAGLRALDLKTITEASSSLGAGWTRTLTQVVLPNLTTALLAATVLTVAMVLGEYTISSLALYTTFPVWLVTNDQSSATVTVAGSVFALFITWLVLLIITVAGTRRGRRTGRQVSLFTVARQDNRG
ncbi:MAG TPA: ABC transporter permease [Streptosporangiaceae bacterium]|jgi:putative spermidine/putrescine transport system permease protein